MKFIETNLEDVVIIEPPVFGDNRGFFMETHHQIRYAKHGVAKEGFVQDNMSLSQKGVLRGLHFQNPNQQGKLVCVVQGEVFDVAVDIRLGSPTFAQWTGITLSHNNKRQLYIPPGFAHGFVALSNTALVMYKCTAYYDKDAESSIAWNDPDVSIDWPISDPTISEKDLAAPTLSKIERSLLPRHPASTK